MDRLLTFPRRAVLEISMCASQQLQKPPTKSRISHVSINDMLAGNIENQAIVISSK